MASTKGGWAGVSGAGSVVRGNAYGAELTDRLRAENKALQAKVSELEVTAAEFEALRAAVVDPEGSGETEGLRANLDGIRRLRADNAALKERVAEFEARAVDAGTLRAELDEALRRNEEKRQDRRALDREIVEMRSMLAEAERQLGNIRQTFVYRIGDAIVAARTWKGFRSLPRRLLGLRRAFLERKGLSGPASVQQKRVAEHLRYVEEALKVLATQGLDAAADHVRAMPDRHANEKARTLVELAQAVRQEQPDRAGALGVEAATLNPLEVRLRALVLALFDQGAIRAPAAVLASMSEGTMARPADLVRRETILAHQRQLSSPLTFPKSAAPVHAGAPRLAVVSPRSLPQHAEAITFRAQAVLEAARAAGHEAILVTAPGYQYPKSGDGGPVTRKIGDTEVIRLGAGDAPAEAFDGFVTDTGATLTALFLRLRINKVHAMAGTPLAAAALWAARRVGARFTLDIGGIPAFGDGVEPAWEATERFRAGYSLFADVARGADQTVVRSSAVAQDLKARGVMDDPTIVEDALPVSFVRASAASVRDIRRELGLANQRLIGVFEAIDNDEGLADLVRALPAIRQACPDAAILFCGSGRGGQTLLQLAAKLDVADHVLIPAGFVRQRTADYLSAFSVAVFPKRRDASPGLSAAFELQAALAVGAPVVAADNPWARDWIAEGETGLTVAAGDVEGLTRAILRFLGDDALVNQIGEAGRALVQARSRRAVIDPRILAILADTSGLAAA
jgi:glycosyltransferase involved in cell wall biosynthesis